MPEYGVRKALKMQIENLKKMEMSVIAKLASDSQRIWTTPAPGGFRAKVVLLLGRLLPDCKKVSAWISEEMEQKLTLKRRIVSRLHMAICTWCVRYREQVLLIREGARKFETQAGLDERPASGPALSDSARDRLKDALIAKKLSTGNHKHTDN